MVEKKSRHEKKVKIKSEETVGLTDINRFEYGELQKLWIILQEYNKFDNSKIKNKNK